MNLVDNDDKFMNDFLNDQIGDEQLRGDDELLAGLIDEEEALILQGSADGPSDTEFVFDEGIGGETHNADLNEHTIRDQRLMNDQNVKVLSYHTMSGQVQE